MVVSDLLLSSCVDLFVSEVRNFANVIVVDGTITTINEPQLIRLNQSIPDPVTGRFGSVPLTGAKIEIKIDTTTTVLLTETEPGRYQAPDGFTGRIGHAYQLRFTLKDGTTHYESDQQVIEPVAPIGRVYAQFNPASLTPTQQLNGVHAAAHDFYIDFHDPAERSNYYRWAWILWERQAWCHTCVDGIYQIYRPDSTLLEDCSPYISQYASNHYTFDYNCRSSCWEIMRSSDLNLFSDQLSNGGTIKAKRVAQIPLYSKEHCLVEIRQSSLPLKAYQYFNQFANQTQTMGSLVDTPPAALVGNVYNINRSGERVVGYFTASAICTERYWLTRSDATSFAPGLFQALNGGREPIPETGVGPPRYRPPLAVCAPSDSRTPLKPVGWRD